MDHNPAEPHVHVLVFPFPAQSHVSSMLKFAELLCLANLKVTFLSSHYIHDRLFRCTDVEARFANYPGLIRFKTIPDGLPEDHPRCGHDRVREMFESTRVVTKPLFREMMVSGELSLGSSTWSPVTCIVADGVMSFAIDVAKDIGIMSVSFRTISASCYRAYFSIPRLIEAGELPFQGNVDMDMPIEHVPGMEGFLRRRDLPGFCRSSNLADPILQFVISESQHNARADALIVNTFEGLEAPALAHIRTHIIPNTYAIGPLHSHLQTRLGGKTAVSLYTLWEADRNCLTWLDTQPSKSVVYVSFGSAVVMTSDQLLEFWYGLLNSKKRFLWVMRPDLVTGKDETPIPAELLERTSGVGCLVDWAPQEEVLGHRAIGGFLTHSGWNSTLESIMAGVPMICWPYFADQMVNSRFVSEAWKLGVDMKDLCARGIVEKMVNDLMVERREEFERSADEMARLARESVSQGGSSFCKLDRLIKDIRINSQRASKTSIIFDVNYPFNLNRS